MKQSKCNKIRTFIVTLILSNQKVEVELYARNIQELQEFLTKNWGSDENFFYIEGEHS